MTDLLEHELRAIHRPTLTDHIHYLGPKEWLITSNKLAQSHKLFSLTFDSTAQLLQELEKDKAAWSHAAIIGHTLTSTLYPFTRLEKQMLREKNYNDFTIAQDKQSNDNHKRV